MKSTKTLEATLEMTMTRQLTMTTQLTMHDDQHGQCGRLALTGIRMRIESHVPLPEVLTLCIAATFARIWCTQPNPPTEGELRSALQRSVLKTLVAEESSARR